METFWTVVWLSIILISKEEIGPDLPASFFHLLKCCFRMYRSTFRIREEESKKFNRTYQVTNYRGQTLCMKVKSELVQAETKIHMI